MGDTQNNWITLEIGPNHHFKYHLQLKTEEDVEDGGKSVMRGYQEKQSK